MKSSSLAIHGRLRKVFLDTNFLVAFFAEDDDLHKESLLVHKRIVLDKPELLISWPIIGETVALLRYRYGYEEARVFSGTLSAYQIMEVSNAHYREAMGVWHTRAKEYRLSLVDAITYVLVSQDEVLPVVTFDQDFRRLGVSTIPA